MCRTYLLHALWLWFAAPWYKFTRAASHLRISKRRERPLNSVESDSRSQTRYHECFESFPVVVTYSLSISWSLPLTFEDPQEQTFITCLNHMNITLFSTCLWTIQRLSILLCAVIQPQPDAHAIHSLRRNFYCRGAESESDVLRLQRHFQSHNCLSSQLQLYFFEQCCHSSIGIPEDRDGGNDC